VRPSACLRAWTGDTKVFLARESFKSPTIHPPLLSSSHKPSIQPATPQAKQSKEKAPPPPSIPSRSQHRPRLASPHRTAPLATHPRMYHSTLHCTPLYAESSHPPCQQGPDPVPVPVPTATLDQGQGQGQVRARRLTSADWAFLIVPLLSWIVIESFLGASMIHDPCRLSGRPTSP
jgi:hypothetical protein